MIVFRTSGIDSNPPGASSFVGIPQPIGVRDGDIVVVGITLPAANVVVTPPDSSWTLVVQTDPSLALGIVVFWKLALNEPASWVFKLSSSIQATGTVAIYLNTDPFSPVEAFAEAQTAPSATVNIPAVSPSAGGEELVLFLGAATAGTFATATNYLAAQLKTQASSSAALQRRQLQAPGTVPATSVVFSAAVRNASVLIVLRPGFGQLTLDEVRARIIAGFPQGVENVYDLAVGGDYFKYFQAIAGVMKAYGYDLVDLLREEIVPYLARYKLPDWERIFGLQTTRTTLLGTIPQRQAQVLSAWRAASGQGSTAADVAAVLGPLLGYFPTTVVEILEADRAALTVLHSYPGAGTPISTPQNVVRTFDIFPPDSGVVSHAGARVLVDFAAGADVNYEVTLKGPDAVTHTRTFRKVAGALTQQLFFIETSGLPLALSHWVVTVKNLDATAGTLNSVFLFVEGIAQNLETGGAIFHWGVYADPIHLGENGTPADFAAARRAIELLGQAHTIGSGLGGLIQSKDPWPDVLSGPHAAIPDEAIPV